MAFHQASRMATPPGYHTSGGNSRQLSPADLPQATYREPCDQLPLPISRTEPLSGIGADNYMIDIGSCSPTSQSQTFSRASSQMTPATSHEDLDFCYQDSPRLVQYPSVPTQSSYPDPGHSTSMHIDLRLHGLNGEEQLREPKVEPWTPPPLRNPSPGAAALSMPPSEDDSKTRETPVKNRPKHFNLPDDVWCHDVTRPELTEQYIELFCTKYSVRQSWDSKGGQRIFIWPEKVPYIAVLALCFLSTSEQRLKEAQDGFNTLGMPVADIYKWVEAHTDKVTSSHDGKGFQNSLRHNLSMNDAFRRISKDTGEEVLKRNGKKADERGTIWVILDWDAKGNMQSTAAYRKNKKPNKPVARKRSANRARAESGRRGGQAASRSRIFRQERRDAERQEAFQQHRMMSMEYMTYPQPSSYPLHGLPSVTHGLPVSHSQIQPQPQPFFPPPPQQQQQQQDYQSLNYNRGSPFEYNQHQNGQSNVGAYTYNSQNTLSPHPPYGPPPAAVTSYPYSPPAMARDATQSQVGLGLHSDYNPMVTSAPMMMGNDRIVGSSGPFQPQWDGQHFASAPSETSDLQ